MMTSLNLQSVELPNPYITTTLTDVTHKLPMDPPCRILLKNELEQPSGSFKLRGIGHLIHKSIEDARINNPQKEIHVFASSGGNAGLAAAYLAFFYKVKCTVVLPVIAKAVVTNKLADYNANVICFGNTINEADQHLKNIIASLDTSNTIPIYCHPFQHPLVWEGHSSLVDEIVQYQLPKEDAQNLKGMVCSCGGGGLYNGIYQGLIKNNIKDLTILLLETAQAPTLFESLKADKLITLSSVNSMATSLACSHTTAQTLVNFHDHTNVTTNLELIDDLDALKACIEYYDAFDKIVEPACGAAVAVIYNKLDLLFKNFGHLKKDDIVVIVVCGGSCSTSKDIVHYQKIINRSELKM